MATGSNVTRDAAWVEREYGREKWPQVLAMIREEIAEEGDEPSLSRVVSRVARREWYGDRGGLAAREAIFGGARASVPAAVAHGGHQRLIVESVIAACSPETDLVAELGSGWGYNLFNTWLGGGPADARYVAAEYTEAGREATCLLAALEDRLMLTTVEFDYHAPDRTEIDRATHAVVFTAHSIEQIPALPSGALEWIASLADRVTCVHLEPVSWQVEDAAGGSSREYAERHDYNRNLIDTLRRAAADARLTIDLEVTDVVGENPENSTTLVVWRTAG